MIGTKSHLSDARPEFIALGLLWKDSLHGYELYKRYENSLGKVWRISQSQMYSLLKRVEAQGLIEGTETGSQSDRSKHLLALTPSGRERFSEWLKTASDCNTRIIRFEFIARLHFARLYDPDLTSEIIASQRSSLERHLANHSVMLSRIDGGDFANRLSLELRVRQIDSLVRWIDECLIPASLDISRILP